MKSLINGLGSGFGRSIGRILGFIFIGYIIYLLINYLGIDIKSIIPIYIPNFNIGGLL